MFGRKFHMTRVFLLIAITLLGMNKAKANSLEDEMKKKSVVEDLLNAADKLNGVGKNLCVFLASDMPSSGIDNSISWIKPASSLNEGLGGINTQYLNESLALLKQTSSGEAILSSLEKAGISKKYEAITVHIGNIKELINTNAPMAFNSMVQTSPKAKALPFIVLNKNKMASSQSQMAIVVANELFDILGRISAGEQVTASSDYQALGIVYSDIILKNDLTQKSGFTKTDIISTYQKAIKNYSSSVPSLKTENLNQQQVAALNNLTSLATAGQFKTFSDLHSMSS